MVPRELIIWKQSNQGRRGLRFLQWPAIKESQETLTEIIQPCGVGAL